MTIAVDKDQFMGAEIADMCNRAIRRVKEHSKEYIEEMDICGPHNIIMEVTEAARGMTDNDWTYESAYELIYNTHRKEIEAYIRAA